MRTFVADLDNRTGNLEPGDIYPDRMAPILRRDDPAHVLQMARWGLPAPAQFHIASGIDRGITNVRDTASVHWRRWLRPDNRCLVPLTKFAEPRGKGAGNAWFEVPDDQPAFFAGIWVPKWQSIRKLKDGETVDDLYAFLNCEANDVVAPIHDKAMPVILTEADEWQTWLSAPWAEAAKLQRPLPDDLLQLLE